VIVKQTPQTAVVVEYRTITEFDTLDNNKDFEGVIVYTIDVGKDSNQNAIKLMTTNNPRRTARNQVVGSLQAGESVRTDGLTVTVVSKNAAGYLVQFSK
jgi:riboflavin synthase alpha subunit